MAWEIRFGGAAARDAFPALEVGLGSNAKRPQKGLATWHDRRIRGQIQNDRLSTRYHHGKYDFWCHVFYTYSHCESWTQHLVLSLVFRRLTVKRRLESHSLQLAMPNYPRILRDSSDMSYLYGQLPRSVTIF